MTDSEHSWKKTLRLYGLWLLIISLSALVAFQVHATLVAVGWFVLQTPSLRPTAWSSNTISAIARFLYLVVGGGWLFGMALVEGYLREAERRERLWPQARRMVGLLAAVYIGCYLLLLLLTWVL